jgi:DNA-binding phage protein
VAWSRGNYRGRKWALTEIRSRAAAREPKMALAKEFNVSRETLYQALQPGCAV